MRTSEERVEAFRTVLATVAAIFVSYFGTAFEIGLVWSLATNFGCRWYRAHRSARRGDSADI